MRILVLSPYLPHARVGHGGGMAVRGVVSHLARSHSVSLVSLLRPGEESAVADVAALGVEVVPVPFLDNRARGAARLKLATARMAALGRALHSRYPFYVQKYGAASLTGQIVAAVARIRPDALQVEYLQLALALRAIRRWRDAEPGSPQVPPRPRLVLNTHELGSLPRRRRAAQANSKAARAWHTAEARAWERLQRDATRWADVTLCVTEQDRRLLAEQGGQDLQTVPLGIDTQAIRPDWRPVPPDRILFVGSFAHPPNRTAAKILVDKIWPQVAQYLKSGQLLLAGRGSRALIRALEVDDPRVRALGYVEDLTKLFRECRLFAAPLTEGGGIKVKILEAMAHGIPVVTTPIGAEGIVESTEDALLIADPIETFADHVMQALRAPQDTRRRAQEARRIIEDRFSWSAITERLTSIYGGR